LAVSLYGVFIELAAAAWSASLEDVINSSRLRGEEQAIAVDVGSIDSAPARVANCLRVQRPGTG
jgi:hypothetical protein